MINIINLTPHVVNVGETIFPASGKIARVSQTWETTTREGISVSLTISRFGDVLDLPEEREDTYLIVSSIVAQACPGRQDLLVPGEVLRDNEGRITGCKSLCIFWGVEK